MKRFLSIIVILGFMGGSLFGIFAMSHNQNSHKNIDCPISPLHTPVCPIGALPMATHSISMYQAFTNGLISLLVTQMLMIISLFVVIGYILRRDVTSIQHLFATTRNFDANLRRPQAITRWLSLLINSPAFN